jgi:hypothetical protein
LQQRVHEVDEGAIDGVAYRAVLAAAALDLRMELEPVGAESKTAQQLDDFVRRSGIERPGLVVVHVASSVRSGHRSGAPAPVYPLGGNLTRRAGKHNLNPVEETRTGAQPAGSATID